MTRNEWLCSAYELHGDNTDAALKHLAATDPDLFGAYLDAATTRAYKADYRAWVRSLTREVDAENLKSSSDVRLFEVDATDHHLIRERVVLTLDGERHEYDQLGLAGEDGADVLRKVATRDMRPARTAIVRCKLQMELAEALVSESHRLGRDVTVAELLGIGKAA